MVAMHYKTYDAPPSVTFMGICSASSGPTVTTFMLRDATAVRSLKKHLLPVTGGTLMAIAEMVAIFVEGTGPYCSYGWGSKN